MRFPWRRGTQPEMSVGVRSVCGVDGGRVSVTKHRVTKHGTLTKHSTFAKHATAANVLQ
jgi:hypothetical protein